MAKRFIDTNIFRKDFIRGLDAPYKLLWFYIINECDHAGIWDVELEVAEIRLGVKLDKTAIFVDKIIQIDGGKKWFIPSFVEFQYGNLNPENRVHLSIINTLKKYDLYPLETKNKPLTSPLQGAKDMDKDMVLVKDMEKDMDRDKEKKAENQNFASNVLKYLNKATGRSFNTMTPDYQKLITARQREGATEENFQNVIDYKTAEWMGTEFEKYVAPKTLFSTKHFQEYLDQVTHAKEKGLTAKQINGSGRKDKASQDEARRIELKEILRKKYEHEYKQ